MRQSSPFFLKFSIDQIAPRLPPGLQRFRLVPVGGVDSVEYIVAVFIPDAVTVLVQHIFRRCFGPKLPSAFRDA